MKLIIIDDETLIVQGIRAIIEKSALQLTEIFQASDGQDAFEICLREKPELILTDIRMPKMDGLELISRLKKESDYFFKAVIISSYDDFEYARRGIQLGIENYITKPINQEELITTLQETITKIEQERLERKYWTEDEQKIFHDNYLRKILKGDISEDELLMWQDQLADYQPWPDYSVFALKTKMVLNREQIQTLIELFKKLTPYLEIVHLEADELAIVTQGFSDKMRQELHRLLTPTELFQNLFLTVGPLVNNFSEIADSFALAHKNLAYSLVYGYGNLISEKEVTLASIVGSSIVTSEEIFNWVSEKDPTLFIQNLNAIETKMHQLKLSPQAIQNGAISLGIQIYQTATKFGLKKNDEIIETRELVHDITALDTTDEIIAYLKNRYLPYISPLGPSNSKYSPVIQMIIQTVNDDLAIHHSLKTLSAKFNMNSAYLGQLFQKEVGKTFNQYSHQVRMEQANNLLLNTDIKISDISSQLGYEDVSYFYRSYKKDFNITPNKVRANKLLTNF